MTLLNRFIIGSFLICLQFCSNVNGRYYWVDYNGVVPEDAVIGGFKEADLVWVGQALFLENNVGLQPVAVINGSKTVHAAHGENVYEVSSHIKVLCSDEELLWHDWKNNIPNKIVGGSESNIEDLSELEVPLYIGNANYRGYIVVGKILDIGPTKALIFEYDGTSQMMLNFAVLTNETVSYN